MLKTSGSLLAVVAMLSWAAGASADTFGTGANQFTIDFVTIAGDAGDLGSWPAGRRYTFTGVNRGAYRISTFEITNDQWNKFRNSLGVPVTGDPPDAYDVDPDWTGTNVPTNEVSWYEAAQFVNWLNTSKGYQAAYNFTGTQGQSDYAFNTWSPAEADGGTNLYRHKDAMYYLPTEDEWIKAAYWNGTSLQTWATPDDTPPIEDVEANYKDEAGAQPWDVGSGSQELNATYDMMGNVWEWMESQFDMTGYEIRTDHPWRGGAYGPGDGGLASSSRGIASGPFDEIRHLGFRIAAGVPGPFELGDLNCDGEVNSFDIDPFVTALVAPEDYQALRPNCAIGLADINADDTVDFFDIDPFVTLLVGD